MDPQSPEWREAALRLMQKAGPDQAAAEALLAKAKDCDYWRGLNPQLTVETTSARNNEEPLPDPALTACLDSIRDVGYFRMPVRLPATEIEGLTRSEERRVGKECRL